MTPAELIRWLLESTFAVSAAIVLVLLLRPPLRAAFGANAAYLLWALPPLAMLAASLPAPVARALPADVLVRIEAATAAGNAPLAAGVLSLSWLLPAWLAGAIALAAWQVVLQRRFRRSLGRVRPDGDGHARAGGSAGLPAVVGLRARIVLPADFEARYSAGERALILAHERIHRARGDVFGNLLLAALHCVYWFNPLAWIAAERFRRDQELACDESVVARHPRSRRLYAEAMVKTQLSALPAPLACHWFGGHPLKERIAMLKRPIPGRTRVAAGLAVAGLAVAGIAYAVWAARPATRVADDAAASIVAQPAATSVDADAAGDAGASVDIRSKAMAPPKYPADAAANRITGKVVLLIDVAADGSVADARVEKSEPAGVFDQVTLDAVKRWKFEPAMQDGKPVAGRVRVPVSFEMDRDGGASDSGADGHSSYSWMTPDSTERIAGMSCDAIQGRTGGPIHCGTRNAPGAD